MATPQLPFLLHLTSTGASTAHIYFGDVSMRALSASTGEMKALTTAMADTSLREPNHPGLPILAPSPWQTLFKEMDGLRYNLEEGRAGPARVSLLRLQFYIGRLGEIERIRLSTLAQRTMQYLANHPVKKEYPVTDTGEVATLDPETLHVHIPSEYASLRGETDEAVLAETLKGQAAAEREASRRAVRRVWLDTEQALAGMKATDQLKKMAAFLFFRMPVSPLHWLLGMEGAASLRDARAFHLPRYYAWAAADFEQGGFFYRAAQCRLESAENCLNNNHLFGAVEAMEKGAALLAPFHCLEAAWAFFQSAALALQAAEKKRAAKNFAEAAESLRAARKAPSIERALRWKAVTALQPPDRKVLLSELAAMEMSLAGETAVERSAILFLSAGDKFKQLGQKAKYRKAHDAALRAALHAVPSETRAASAA